MSDRKCEHCCQPMDPASFHDQRFCTRQACYDDRQGVIKAPWEIASTFGVPPGWRGSYKTAALMDFPKMDRLSDETGNLFIHGANGRGKTHLMAAIALDLADGSGAPALLQNEYRWIDAADIFLELRESFREKSKCSELEIVKRFTQGYSVLFIDDMFAEKTTDYTVPAICQILRQREQYDRRTIITSNLSIGEIAPQSPRIASLLTGYEDVELKGKDRRKDRQ